MKVYIDKEEWYPVFSVTDDKEWAYPWDEIEVDEAFFNDAKRIFGEFQNLQKKLERLYSDG